MLFGNSDTILPGGYAGEEISPDSPINQVTEFPQELVLLGIKVYGFSTIFLFSFLFFLGRCCYLLFVIDVQKV